MTNVHRHAGASTATVRVDYGDELTVAGRRRRPRRRRPIADGGGSGIVGMRERAAAARRALEAGPRAEGGFRVRGPPAAAGRDVISVLLADDQALVRAGFRVLLESRGRHRRGRRGRGRPRGRRAWRAATAPTWC